VRSFGNLGVWEEGGGGGGGDGGGGGGGGFWVRSRVLGFGGEESSATKGRACDGIGRVLQLGYVNFNEERVWCFPLPPL
jgi:hypothetical protein